MMSGASGRRARALRESWLSPHAIARQALRRALAAVAAVPRGTLLDLGCGSKPYAGLFPGVRWHLGLDVEQRGGADVIGSALHLPVKDGGVDSILATELLEHLPEPAVLFREVHRALRPGGVLLLTTPQVWGLHEEPHDYYRFTRYGLAHLARAAGFQVIDVIPSCGTWAMVGQRLAAFIYYTHGHGRNVLVKALAAGVAVAIQIPSWILDRLYGGRGDTLDNLLVAVKPEEPAEPHDLVNPGPVI